jgi:hypothetical protein
MPIPDKFTPGEAKAVDALIESFNFIRVLNIEEKERVKEAIFVMLKLAYPNDFLEVENIQLNFVDKDKYGYESVV